GVVEAARERGGIARALVEALPGVRGEPRPAAQEPAGSTADRAADAAGPEDAAEAPAEQRGAGDAAAASPAAGATAAAAPPVGYDETPVDRDALLRARRPDPGDLALFAPAAGQPAIDPYQGVAAATELRTGDRHLDAGQLIEAF